MRIYLIIIFFIINDWWGGSMRGQWSTKFGDPCIDRGIKLLDEVLIKKELGTKLVWMRCSLALSGDSNTNAIFQMKYKLISKEYSVL